MQALSIELLGPLRIMRDGRSLPVPASRKTRAILGLLVLSQRPVTRQKLCELLFDVPDDPRAALRWSLTKLRPLVDDGDAVRLVTERDRLHFRAGLAQVDVLRLQAGCTGDLGTRDTEALRDLLALCRGPLLEDSDLPGRPEYSAWLAALRADFRALERRLLDALIHRAAAQPDALPPLWQRRVNLDPLDEQAYAGLASALRDLGRLGDADAMVATGERALRAGGVTPSVLLRAAALPRPRRAAIGERSHPLAGSAAPEPAAGAPSAGPPVVAVLPFRDLSREPLPAYLADGLLDGVVHELSRFRSLEVLARLSTEAFRDRVEDPVTLGRSLGADVLVGGTLAAAGTHLRIRWTIAETRQGRLVGSGEETHAVDDPLGLSGEVATRIAVSIEPLAQTESLARAERKPKTSLAAYDHFLRGLYGAFSPDRNSDYPAAIRCFRAALEADPGFAPAAAFLPWAAVSGNLIRSAEDMQAYAEYARLAVRQAGDDARSLAIGGSALLLLTGDFDTALDCVERALRINPNEYSAWIQAGWVFMLGGEYERPMACFARAERLNHTGVAEVSCRSMRAFCHYFHDELEPAETLVRRALLDAPTNFWNNVVATAIAAERGAISTARERAGRLLQLAPEGLASVQLASVPCRQKGYVDRIRAALRAAGVPG